jgi:hypothetical protein
MARRKVEIEDIRVHNGIGSIEPKVDHGRERQVLSCVSHSRKRTREDGANRCGDEQRLPGSQPSIGNHPHAEKWTKDTNHG